MPNSRMNVSKENPPDVQTACVCFSQKFTVKSKVTCAANWPASSLMDFHPREAKGLPFRLKRSCFFLLRIS